MPLDTISLSPGGSGNRSKVSRQSTGSCFSGARLIFFTVPEYISASFSCYDDKNMIYSLSGKLTAKKEHFAVVLVGGLGMKVYIPAAVASDLPPVGTNVDLFCHLHVREDALDLYGFLTEAELGLFEALISVTGVGPKSALNIMSVTRADQLAAAINEGRTELLTKASGIGRKTAERVVLELKGKLSFGSTARTLNLLESDLDLEEALVGLGYSKQQAKAAISRIDPKLKDFNSRLKEALRQQKQ